VNDDVVSGKLIDMGVPEGTAAAEIGG